MTKDAPAFDLPDTLRVAIELANEHGCEVRISKDGAIRVIPTGERKTSTERVRAYRERKRRNACNAETHVTLETQETVSPSPSLSSSPQVSPTPPSSPTPTLPPTPTGTREELALEADETPETKPSKPKAWNPTEQQIQVARWFNRRPITVWSERELKAWKALRIEDEDLEILQWFYTESGCRFLRKDLLTLLNNWRGEVDRARNFDPEQR